MRVLRPLVVVFVAALAVFSASFHGCGTECKPPCTGANICINGVCTFDAGPACTPACTDGQSCVSGQCRANHPGITCAAPALINGGVAGPATAPPIGGCTLPIQPTTANSPATFLDLGQRVVGTVVPFVVPPNTGTIVLMSQVVQAPDTVTIGTRTKRNAVVPDLVTAPPPSSTVWFNDNDLPADSQFEDRLHQPFESDAVNAFTIPSTSTALEIARTGLPAGTWQFKVNDYAYECATQPNLNCDGGAVNSVYDMTLVMKPVQPATGKIDVAIYLVSNTGVNAAGALTDPKLQRVASTLNTLYAQAGICVNSVRFYDVPDWARQRYAAGIDGDEEGPCSNMNQLFTLSTGAAGIHLFLVNQIGGGGGGGSILGIDGLIPGPSTFAGTVGSGAVVSADSLQEGTCPPNTIHPGSCGADLVAYIAAHEGGHWLGLYHTSESYGGNWDPIKDTPKCVCQTCTTGAAQTSCMNFPNYTRVTHETCGNLKPDCGGEDNLMFWIVGSDAKDGIVSPQQAEIMRSNLAIY